MIKKLLSNAMLSLVMDKQAKEKLHALRGGRKTADSDNSGARIAPAKEATEQKPSPDRQELIAQAMAIHQSKSAILDDLTLNEKRQLQELAAKALLGSIPNDRDE